METTATRAICSVTECCIEDPWFDDIISSIRADQVQLASDTASEEKKEFYKVLRSDDENKTFSIVREQSSRFFIGRLIYQYIAELNRRNGKPEKLAMKLSNSKLLVWAIIKDDDEKTEDALFLSEASVNANFEQFGFHISSTILEESDNYPIPSHYRPVDFLANG